MAKRQVRRSYSPSQEKQPRISPKIGNPMDQTPVWLIGSVDVDGPWGWSDIEKKMFFSEILPKIKSFETMFWRDILHRNNHEVPVAKIITSAQKRLEQLKLDDTETLVSLRLTGPKRIWGIRVENILKILWWDPLHKVCPSKLKHT